MSLTTLAKVLSALSRNATIFNASSRQDQIPLPPSLQDEESLKEKQPSMPPVPYRDSKLTYLLKDSLGGNSKTLMITTLRPTEEYHKQTLMSLMYAARAKHVKNRLIMNVDVVGDSGLNKVRRLASEDPNFCVRRQLICVCATVFFAGVLGNPGTEEQIAGSYCGV